MKTVIFASSLVLLSALACAAPVQPATNDAADTADTREMQNIRLEVMPDAGKKGQPKLQLRHKRANSDLSLDANLADRRPEFAAVRSALGTAGPVRFTVKHEAGTLDCSGTVTRAYEGEGQCSFAPDAAFGRALDERGLALDAPADQLTDATIALADGLIREGVPPKEADDLIAAAALDVTGDYVRDLKSEAIVLTDIDDAIACKALGVDGAYVRGLAAAGYRKLSADDVVAMKALGVTGDYAQAMNRAAGGECEVMRLSSFAALAAALCAMPAAAQELPPTGDTPPPASTEVPPGGVSSAARQVYTPADFTRYAPNNAYDMLNQVPSFQIRDNESLRGLGQATGNVLFNGERPSNKGDDMYTQLSRIPAGNVERIEIVDGATLDIPGLSGQVANIIYRADNFSGQFSWKPEFRVHYTDPLLTRGDVSVRGRTGDVEYEAALSNDDSARSGAGGPTLIYDRAGNITERRRDVWNTHYDTPKLSGRITWDPAGDTVANLGGHYQRKYDRYYEDGLRIGPGMPDRVRTVYENADSWNYEVSGDYQFGLGPGKLKLIGLRRFSHEPYAQEIVTTPDDGTPATGDRFAQTGDLGETIARGEYQWKMFGGDWQLSGEGAFSKLDNVASIAVLNPLGVFVGQPFEGGTGGVSEDRYEGLLSFGRKLTDKLNFQIIAGAEHSTITQTGVNGLTRTFFRPKGSISLAWTPSANFDVSVKLRRRVLQLSFYDFLARAFLNDGNQNESNNDLRPQQDWTYEAEINRKFGAWGSTKVILIYRDVEDRVDVIPIGTNGEAVGNIAKAKAGAIDWTSTINLDPAGLKGVKVDTRVLLQKSTLRDPFTGEKRQWNGFTDTVASVALRHDIAGSDFAWGGDAEYSHYQPNYRRNQTDKVWEGPVWASVFVEHKNVMGLTVRAQIRNIVNARSKRDRTVYTGVRGESPVSFVEERDRLIGPIFSFSVRGKF